MKKPFIIIASIFMGIIILKMFTNILTITAALNSSILSIFFVLPFALIAFLFIIKIFNEIKKNSKRKIALENIPNEFEEIYKKLYEENIHTLEGIRKKVRWLTVFESIALIGVFTGNMNRNPEISLLMILAVIGLIFISSKYANKYKKIYKEEIVASFIKLLNNQLEYKPTSTEFDSMEEDYRIAKFDYTWFNRFYPDDYIEGFLDNDLFVKMGNLHVQKHTGSGKNSRTEELFHGMFAHTSCGKDIGTYIKISRNQTVVWSKKDRVEMDSQEFEKYFDIYSENKLVTMQLLTSDVMSTLVDFYNKYYIDYEIVIKNNKIYIRFFTGAMFEPKVFGNAMDKKLLFYYYCILKFIVDVTKEVNKALQDVEI